MSRRCPILRDGEEPLNRDTLGYHSWNLLHTMAAYYPSSPTLQDQQDMLTFITLLGRLYPCKMCAEHWREKIARSPPQVQSRSALMVWFCQMHNEINVANGKKEFPCSIDCLVKRWGPA